MPNWFWRDFKKNSWPAARWNFFLPAWKKKRVHCSKKSFLAIYWKTTFSEVLRPRVKPNPENRFKTVLDYQYSFWSDVFEVIQSKKIEVIFRVLVFDRSESLARLRLIGEVPVFDRSEFWNALYLSTSLFFILICEFVLGVDSIAWHPAELL